MGNEKYFRDCIAKYKKSYEDGTISENKLVLYEGWVRKLAEGKEKLRKLNDEKKLLNGVKMFCPICGSTITVNYFKQHKKTKKCLNFA